MRLLTALILIASLVVVAGISTGPIHAAKRSPLHVTFVGDSVPDAITYVSAARRRLTKGFVVRLDLRVCRRLATPSCTFQGSRPASALEAVQTLGKRLGNVLVVDVGYNEGPVGYGAGIDRVMRAARVQGATGVVWVTLRETRDLYRQTNAVIRLAAKRWPKSRQRRRAMRSGSGP